jgi:hypothetical protein
VFEMDEQELPCILDDFPNYRLKNSGTVPERKNVAEDVKIEI